VTSFADPFASLGTTDRRKESEFRRGAVSPLPTASAADGLLCQILCNLCKIARRARCNRGSPINGGRQPRLRHPWQIRVACLSSKPLRAPAAKSPYDRLASYLTPRQVNGAAISSWAVRGNRRTAWIACSRRRAHAPMIGVCLVLRQEGTTVQPRSIPRHHRPGGFFFFVRERDLRRAIGEAGAREGVPPGKTGTEAKPAWGTVP